MGMNGYFQNLTAVNSSTFELFSCPASRAVCPAGGRADFLIEEEVCGPRMSGTHFSVKGQEKQPTRSTWTLRMLFILLGFIAYFVSIKSVLHSYPVPPPGAGIQFCVCQKTYGWEVLTKYTAT